MDLSSHKVTTVFQIPDKIEGQAFFKNFSNCKVGHSFELLLDDLSKNILNEHRYHIDKDLKICELSVETASSHLSSVENSVGLVCHEPLGREFIVFRILQNCLMIIHSITRSFWMRSSWSI